MIAETRSYYENKETEIGDEFMRYLERMIMLQVVDTQWKDHLLGMDHLKEGIGLRRYGQRDPLLEYKKEAFDLFEELTSRISTESVSRIFRVQVRQEREIKKVQKNQSLSYNTGEGAATPMKRESAKVGRNEPCPCGSGKKYKKCCGRNG